MHSGHQVHQTLGDTGVIGAYSSLRSTGPPGSLSVVANTGPSTSLRTIGPNGTPHLTVTTGTLMPSGLSNALRNTDVTGASGSLRQTDPPGSLCGVANTGPSASLSTAGPLWSPIIVTKRGPSGSLRTVAHCLLAVFPRQNILDARHFGISSFACETNCTLWNNGMCCCVLLCSCTHFVFLSQFYIRLIHNKGYRNYCHIMRCLHHTWRSFGQPEQITGQRDSH